MQVRIKTDPRSNGATIEPTDADGVAMNEQINGCYAYDVRQQVGEPARATLFVFAETDVTAEAHKHRNLADPVPSPSQTPATSEVAPAAGSGQAELTPGRFAHHRHPQPTAERLIRSRSGHVLSPGLRSKALTEGDPWPLCAGGSSARA